MGNINDLFSMKLPCVIGVVEDGLKDDLKKKLMLDLGISSHKMYFNSGVMLIDIDRYFKENILMKFIDCMKNNRDRLVMYDRRCF